MKYCRFNMKNDFMNKKKNNICITEAKPHDCSKSISIKAAEIGSVQLSPTV